MEYIEINLAQSELALFCDRVAGRQGEANVKGVKFILAEKYKTWSAFVDIENAKGNTYRKETTQTTPKESAFVYDFSKKDLSQKGNINIDLVLINGDKIKKPFTGSFLVTDAICADGNIPDDDIPEGGGSGSVDMSGYAKLEDIPTPEEILDIVLSSLAPAEGGAY